jgi:hypothetical protein
MEELMADEKDRSQDGVTGTAQSSVLDHLRDMLTRARIYEARAHSAGRQNDAVRALKEGRTIIELIARLDQQPIPEPERRFVAWWGRRPPRF